MLELIVCAYRETRLKEGDAMPVPFTELISQYAFYRIPFQRSYRLLFVAEQPEVLIRVHIVIAYLEGQIIGYGNVVYMKRKIVFLILPPRFVFNGLVLIVQGLLLAGEA